MDSQAGKVGRGPNLLPHDNSSHEGQHQRTASYSCGTAEHWINGLPAVTTCSSRFEDYEGKICETERGESVTPDEKGARGDGARRGKTIFRKHKTSGKISSSKGYAGRSVRVLVLSCVVVARGESTTSCTTTPRRRSARIVPRPCRGSVGLRTVPFTTS